MSSFPGQPLRGEGGGGDTARDGARRRRHEAGIQVKIGLHRGPTIAVTSNRPSLGILRADGERAACVQNESRAGEVCSARGVVSGLARPAYWPSSPRPTEAQGTSRASREADLSASSRHRVRLNRPHGGDSIRTISASAWLETFPSRGLEVHALRGRPFWVPARRTTPTSRDRHQGAEEVVLHLAAHVGEALGPVRLGLAGKLADLLGAGLRLPRSPQ